jgi:hypothetical protein
MTDKLDYSKALTGKTWDQLTRTPTFDDALDIEGEKLFTKYPLRILGYNAQSEKRIFVREEQRPHAHLIGSTQEGKSKFLEHLIREDIRRGFGVCLLDPTTGAKTAYDVLRWCCAKNIQKVCLIDPHHRWDYKKIAGINPLLYRREQDGSITKSEKLRKTSVDSVVDTLRILFNTKDPAQTSFINRYLPAVLHCLYNAQAPLSESLYFTNQIYIDQRREIFSYTDPSDPQRLDLEEAFRNARQFEHLQTTINRLKSFFQDPLALMFGVDKGIDFMKMVRDGWVILVNLDSSLDLDVMDARLLGTTVINQILVAMDRLYYKKGDKPTRYYLYIDEAGEYATRKLARTFALKGKTGLRVTIGHQYFGQFEDKFVVDAINALTKLKAMFNLPGREDRDKITKMFYGGEISDRQASFANADIPKQEAVMKVIKGSPQRVRIPDVNTPKVSRDRLNEYITKLYEQPWYYDPHGVTEAHKKKSIYDDQKAGNPKPPRKGAKADKRATVKTVFD